MNKELKYSNYQFCSIAVTCIPNESFWEDSHTERSVSGNAFHNDCSRLVQLEQRIHDMQLKHMHNNDKPENYKHEVF